MFLAGQEFENPLASKLASDFRPFDLGIIRICNITQNDEKDQKDNENKDHGTSTNRISRFPGRYGLGGRT